jgi:nucleotide-binding universal stress UspA family protein
MKRFLTCLDSSPRAEKVLAAAVDLARRTGAKLALFRGVGLPPEVAQSELVGVSPNALVEQLVEKAQKELDALATTIPKELYEASYVVVGTPWDAICREAKKLDCDLIVIGSHGYGGIDRLLGTTAAKVVNHADRSVFVVR